MRYLRQCCLFTLFLTTAAMGRAELPNGVASGDVAQSGAVLWAHSTAIGPLRFDWSLSDQFDLLLGSRIVNVSDGLVPVKVELSAADGLAPGLTYFYRATDAEGDVAEGHFRTPAPLGTFTGLRLGISGDWRGELTPYPSIRNVPDHDLDLWVSLGDTIYADVPSPAVDLPQCLSLTDFRLKHDEVYTRRHGLNTLRALRESTAILAMIDDHEVTNDFAGAGPADSDPRFDDSGGEFLNQSQLFQNGLQAFTEFNPLRDEYWQGTGEARCDGQRKLYRFRTFGSDAAVLMVDARSFRDAELPEAANPLDPASASAYLEASFDPVRSMLGRPQVEQLKSDLLTAQAAGITWKFVLVGEPIQNLGVIYASDRYEGYAAERTELLRFVTDNHLTNVVFVSADIHGTLINNLACRAAPDGPDIQVPAWEISTGSVAYDAPFGLTIFGFAKHLGFVTGLIGGFYEALPTSVQDGIDNGLANLLLEYFGQDRLGLDGSDIPYRRQRGGWVAANSFGWTEFAIDAESQALRITTYAIKPYTAKDLHQHAKQVTSRKPYIISRFTVFPVGA